MTRFFGRPLATLAVVGLLGVAGPARAASAADSRPVHASHRVAFGVVENVGAGMLVVKMRSGRLLSLQVPPLQAAKVRGLKPGEPVDVHYSLREGRLVLEALVDGARAQ